MYKVNNHIIRIFIFVVAQVETTYYFLLTICTCMSVYYICVTLRNESEINGIFPSMFLGYIKLNSWWMIKVIIWKIMN